MQYSAVASAYEIIAQTIKLPISVLRYSQRQLIGRDLVMSNRDTRIQRMLVISFVIYVFHEFSIVHCSLLTAIPSTGSQIRL